MMLICLGVVLVDTSIASLSVSSTHPEGMACKSCHLHGTDTDKATAYLLVSSQADLCGNCHKGAVEASHPSGFVPEINLPESFPLDWKGDFTCSTCHAVHSDNPGYLRTMARGQEFCSQCHESGFFGKMHDGGTSIVLSGHLDARADNAPAALDSYSVQCMSCHGDMAEDRYVRDIKGLTRHTANTTNHPVGMTYTNYVDYGGYRPAAEIPKEIMLPGGKVGCVSCHQGYSEDHGKLVMSNAYSTLCFGCHDL